MSATATPSNTPAVAPDAIDPIDITEAEVLAALGATPETAAPDSTDSDAASTEASAEDETAAEIAATSEAEAAPEAPADEPAPAPEPTAEQKELAALKQQLAELTAKLAAPTPTPALNSQPSTLSLPADRPPLSAVAPEVFETVEDAGELAARELTLSKLHAWTLRNEDGGKIGDLDLPRAEVLELKAATWEALHQSIPQRRTQLAEMSRAEVEAMVAYPALKDPASPEAKAVAQFLAENPALRKLTNAKLIAADAALGRLARTAKATPAAAATPAPRVQPPRAPASAARPGVLPPRTTPSASHLKSATERLNRGNGSVDDVASVIAASLP